MITFHFNKQSPKATRISFVAGKETDVWIKDGGERSVQLGIGERKSVTLRKLILLLRKIIDVSRKYRIDHLELLIADLRFDNVAITPEQMGELIAVSFEMANYEFLKYKTLDTGAITSVTSVSLMGAGDGVSKGIKRGQIIAEEINSCRTLANTPGSEMTPRLLLSEIKKAARGTTIKITALGREDMKQKGMNAVLGVAQGSVEEPQFIIAEYFGGAKSEKPIVLVGKGVTFDTGGLNLKPSQHIYEMHMDMSGGAAVLHTVIAAAKLGMKRNVVALVPAVENMPSGSSYRPGDVIKTLSGQTIEVLDTDAEGRVILSDALTYAEKYKPRLVVDVATLTGAAEVALGQRASAIFTKDQKLEALFRELGELSGDYVWPLPLWDEYEDDIRGTFGDWANLGKKPRAGGSITAAMFLYQFAKNYPWVHIDMAPRMTSIEGEYLAKGAAGTPMRLLIKLLEAYN